MKFRKIGIEVEAFVLGEEWPDWWKDVWDDVGVVTYPKDGVYHVRMAFIDTPEGTIRAEAGDYIIRGVKGEIYPCKPGIFEMTYERVDVNNAD
jgi:hypothetical protein